MGMSPMPRMSHPPGQMQSPLNHTISDLNVSNFFQCFCFFALFFILTINYYINSRYATTVHYRLVNSFSNPCMRAMSNGKTCYNGTGNMYNLIFSSI